MLYLVHHGIKGQKWGVRRYQNEDGSLTPAGRDHYQSGKTSYAKTIESGEYDGYGGRKVKYTTTKHRISSQGTIEKKKAIDRLANDENFDDANFFDRIGGKAAAIAEQKGPEEAVKYLENQLDGYSYEIVINNEVSDWGDWGVENYYGFKLSMIGDDYTYITGGDEDYTDDQYFRKNK